MAAAASVALSVAALSTVAAASCDAAPCADRAVAAPGPTQREAPSQPEAAAAAPTLTPAVAATTAAAPAPAVPASTPIMAVSNPLAALPRLTDRDVERAIIAMLCPAASKASSSGGAGAAGAGGGGITMPLPKVAERLGAMRCWPPSGFLRRLLKTGRTLDSRLLLQPPPAMLRAWVGCAQQQLNSVLHIERGKSNMTPVLCARHGCPHARPEPASVVDGLGLGSLGAGSVVPGGGGAVAAVPGASAALATAAAARLSAETAAASRAAARATMYGSGARYAGGAAVGSTRAAVPPPAVPAGAGSSGGRGYTRGYTGYSYRDDEDAELQAALLASAASARGSRTAAAALSDVW